MSAPSAWVHSDVFASAQASGANHAHVLRLALRLERRSDPKNGIGAFEALANMASGCKMSEASTHRALRVICATGMFKAQARPNEATLYTRDDKLNWQASGGKTHRKLGIKAALDDLGLSPETLTLYLYYGLQTSAKAGHEFRVNDAEASRSTGICRDNVPIHRALLTKAGLLEAINPRTYTFTQLDSWVEPDEYAALEQLVWNHNKTQRANRRAQKNESSTKPLDLPTSDTPSSSPNCRPQTPPLPTSDTPNCRPQTPKGNPVRESIKVVNDDRLKNEKLEVLYELLGPLYLWFCKEGVKRYGEGALTLRLEPFESAALRRVWDVIKRDGTARNKPKMPTNLAHAYALLDLIFDDLQENDPDALKNLRAVTDERERVTKARPKAALPREGAVVRYQSKTYIVNGAASEVVFLEGLDHSVHPAECEPVADCAENALIIVPIPPSFRYSRAVQPGAMA